MQYIHGQTHIGYVIPLNKYSTFVSHYKYEEQEKKSTAIVGFKHRFEQTEIVSTINSRGKVASSVTFKNLFYSFKFCAMIDYIKDKYTFGYGINIGQQQWSEIWFIAVNAASIANYGADLSLYRWVIATPCHP